ncbi:MAG: protein-glutamate O-methyltransferase CheR [Magnetococcales bacterium]|nr:protein-glutamate O-methyltransferase CheR [Magnetococcales bacterium]MBF0155882.1 protein-glutamate O-methyltransferase CheR [Magnetococcales bacterium]
MNGPGSSGPAYNPGGLSDADFQRLGERIHRVFGIRLPASARGILSETLGQRLRQQGISSLGDYLDWVLGADGPEEELIRCVDFITTRKREFFKEPAQLEYLARTALPDLIKTQGAGVRRSLMVWCAGCASGEETYTLTIVLREFAAHYPGINLNAQVLATDVSARALDHSRAAIYDQEEVLPIPVSLKKKYLLRSKDPHRRQVRMVPELRGMVRFRRLNLMDDEFGLRERMDIIFCRDLLIFFDPATQDRLIHQFCRNMIPGGFLFVGPSESLAQRGLPLVQVAPSVYRLPD